MAESVGGRPTFLIEHYRPGLDEAEFLESARLVADAVHDLAATGSSIEFLHYTMVPAEGSAFCVIAATDGTLVEEAYRIAGVSYERLVRAVESSGS